MREPHVIRVELQPESSNVIGLSVICESCAARFHCDSITADKVAWVQSEHRRRVRLAAIEHEVREALALIERAQVEVVEFDGWRSIYDFDTLVRRIIRTVADEKPAS